MPNQVFKLDLSQVAPTSGGLAAALPARTVVNLSDPEYAAVMRNTQGYSITPRTFESRTLVQDTTSGEYSRFIDEYFNGTTRMLRFGIDVSTSDVQAEIVRVNAIITQKLPNVSGTSSQSSGSGSGTSKAVDIPTHRLEAQKQITKYELESVQEAIKYLSTPGQSARTALIDVSERDPVNGKIIPNTVHTVVLFEQNGKYLVIDPSNASFSHILTGASDDIRLCFGKNFKVYAKPQGTTTGPNDNEWRDCIDEATKLAFSIEENLKYGLMQSVSVREDAVTNSGEILLDSLRSVAAVKEVTNQYDTYRKFPKAAESYPIRLKQSSDVKIQKKVTTCLKVLSSQSKALLDNLKEQDLYHAFLATEKKVTDFYNKIATIAQYTAFEQECLVFAGFIDRASGNTEAAALLGLELQAIDQLP